MPDGPQSFGHSVDAQRAYEASITPPTPPRPRLPGAWMRQVRIAGAVGGAMMLGGLDLVLLGVLLLLPIVLTSVLPMLTPVGALLGDGQLLAGSWPWVVVTLLLVGAGLVVGGAMVSLGMLRRVGIARPVMLTAGGLGVGLGVRLVLNVFIVPFFTLLSPLLDRGIAALGAGPEQTTAVIASLAVALAMNTALVASVGMVSWWWLAHATRPAGPQATPVEESPSGAAPAA